MSIQVGQTVYATRDIIHDASGDWPEQLLARRGEKLIVRKTESDFFSAYVSHPEITDKSFGVEPGEITTVEPKIQRG